MASFLRLHASALKFGQITGFAMADNAPGDWVHEHSIAFHSLDRDHEFEVDARDPASVTPLATLLGLRRATGALHWGLFAPTFCCLVALNFGVKASRMGHKEL